MEASYASRITSLETEKFSLQSSKECIQQVKYIIASCGWADRRLHTGYVHSHTQNQNQTGTGTGTGTGLYLHEKDHLPLGMSLLRSHMPRCIDQNIGM